MQVLRRGAVEILEEHELREKLARSLREGRPLRVKLGMDPSAPDIHLGHTVVLRKLRQFQDLGHQVILVIGDFTARVGDPTGRKTTRPALTVEQVRANARTYADQVFRILDPQRTRLVYQEWFEEMGFDDVLRLAATYTVARMLEREDFKNRLETGQPISLHELFYPLMQAYDSVALEADVELGGTDQKFNLLVARDVQREYGQEPEVALLMPLLVGTDGVEKMSKSLGNYIGLTDPPGEMYGKTMSIPDPLIVPYLELLTDMPEAEIERIRQAMASGDLNPRDAKMTLARLLVAQYHGEAAAREAEERFVQVFQRRELPEDIPEVRLEPEMVRSGAARVVDLLVAAGLVESRSEARRMVRQGAVSVDGRRIDDEQAAVAVSDGSVVRVGRRRFARLRLG
ncbi:MAG: tyrosine--tRNA ligase [Thermaerobacter sp.]|nr:MAG: tyrosine--tRNA ligase [Bacillota bacterium]